MSDYCDCNRCPCCGKLVRPPFITQPYMPGITIQPVPPHGPYQVPYTWPPNPTTVTPFPTVTTPLPTIVIGGEGTITIGTFVSGQIN